MNDEALFSRRALAAAIAGAVATGLASSCRREEKPLAPGQVAIALSQLPPGKRVIVVVAENPVEVTRQANGITARMLRCTHWGCVVRWHEPRRAYVCPCHEGTYDEDGNVLAGPPPLPLRTVPLSISGDRVILGG